MAKSDISGSLNRFIRMHVALIGSAQLVFIGSVILALAVIVIAIRWMREINKMKKND